MRDKIKSSLNLSIHMLHIKAHTDTSSKMKRAAEKKIKYMK